MTMTPEPLASDRASAFEAMMPEPVANASKGPVAFFVKWTETGSPLRGSIPLYTADQMRQMFDDATELAAKKCEARAAAYRTTKAPGWHEVDHECTQCAAAIRDEGGAR